MPVDDGAGAGQQIARAAVIAKPRPCGHHIGIVGGGQRLDSRPAFLKSSEIRADGGDRRLLEHDLRHPHGVRSEEHTSELQSLMRISYAVFCLKKKTHNTDSKYSKLSPSHNK